MAYRPAITNDTHIRSLDFLVAHSESPMPLLHRHEELPPAPPGTTGKEWLEAVRARYRAQNTRALAFLVLVVGIVLSRLLAFFI